MKKRTLVFMVIGVLVLCILAGISEIFLTEDAAPSHDVVQSAQGESENQEEKDEEASSQNSPEESNESTEQETEVKDETETTENNKDEEEHKETVVEEEKQLQQAELPEVRENIAIYGDTGSDSYWDIKFYGTLEEAYENLYSIGYTGESRFCIEGFEKASSVTCQIIEQEESIALPNFECLCDGIYSFEGDFEKGDYIVELTFVVEDVQDTVYMGLKFE